MPTFDETVKVLKKGEALSPPRLLAATIYAGIERDIQGAKGAIAAKKPVLDALRAAGNKPDLTYEDLGKVPSGPVTAPAKKP